MKLQSNLTKKETMLADLLCEKDRTILEQQRIIRRLLRKSLSEEERSLTLSCYSSDSTLYTLPDYDHGNRHFIPCLLEIELEENIRKGQIWTNIELV